MAEEDLTDTLFVYCEGCAAFADRRVRADQVEAVGPTFDAEVLAAGWAQDGDDWYCPKCSAARMLRAV